MLLDRVQHFQAAGPGQAQVQQHGVGARTVQQPVGLFGGFRHLRVESERLRHLAASLADGAVVVHDQKVQEVRSLDLRGMAVVVEDGGGRCIEHGDSPLVKVVLKVDTGLAGYPQTRKAAPLREADARSWASQNFHYAFD
jgi:hypothetical protein